MPAAIKNSPSFLFEDDAKIVHTISSAQDYALIQDDILLLKQWCATWKLTISAHKCVAVKFSLRHAASADSLLYHLDNLLLPFSDHHRDLGVIVCNNCSWLRHYNHICSKAYRSLNIIQHTVPQTNCSIKKQLYLTLVQSQISYCSQLWRPYLIKDINQFERIQRWATKYVLNDYTSDYKTRLIKLNYFYL